MIVSSLLIAVSFIAAAPTRLTTMRWQKRVLLVSTSRAGDPLMEEQRRIIERWRRGAADRDLAVVEIVGDAVAGASDGAGALRRKYNLPTSGFGVALIGKDGGTKLRRARPIAAATLERTIDAMPMRRAGQRQARREVATDNLGTVPSR